MPSFELEFVQAPRLLKLPDGVTVGDEFRIAGKVRVTALAEDSVDATGWDDDEQRIMAGGQSVRVRLSEFTVTDPVPA